MKIELFTEVEIPEGVELKLDGEIVEVKGPEGENKRKFNFGKLDVKVKEGKLIMGNKKSSKREKKMMNTLVAHIKNMIRGIQEKFVYELKICFSHFPFTVKVEGTKAVIKNFLGEKVDREFNLPEGAEIEIKKELITVKSVDKEIAGQAAANFETATKIKGRDIRIFQDGIYILNKDGRKM